MTTVRAAFAILAAAAVAVLCGPVAGAAAEEAARQVDVALVLAMDVSASVNDERFQLQRAGYASAFGDPAVIAAIAAGRQHAIAVTLVEWSGATHQEQVVGWTVIESEETARSFGSAIAETPRLFSDVTAVGEAILYGTRLLTTAPFEAERRIVDMSGDGSNNNGRPAPGARDIAVGAGLTVNGLPILGNEAGLEAYYRDNVIGGPGAFMIVVKDYRSFAEAVLDKLVREIAALRGAAPADTAAE
ncbi:MAG TPA: DUF1194 domain-containing protein [Stellaceae bacterium]